MNKLPTLLMSASLGLLLVFLSFWLRSEYKAEQAGMNKEVNFMFVNDIREIEDHYFRELLKPLQDEGLDSFTTKSIESIRIMTTDIQNADLAFLKKEQVPDSVAGRNMKVVIRSHENSENEKQLDGSISMWMSLEEQEGADSVHIIQQSDSLQTFTLINDHFAESIQHANLELEYEIIEMSSDSTLLNESFTSRYFDTFSNKNYVLQLDNYQGILLKRMLPQILFSIFLFSCIALAFYVVFRNLQKQKRLTLLKNDFISNVTHELKTPITTVAVAIEALKNFDALKNPEQTKEYLNISQNELNRLSILVDKVLKMSMFEQEEPELKLEWIDLKILTQEILNTMKLQFDKFAAQVNFQTSGNAFLMKGDRIHLTSVLYNLIDNALKYSLDNPQINIAIASLDKNLQLTVEDQGMGISKDDADRIFDKFFRVPTGDEHNIKGYGLGLSYVSEVVKKHQGSINLVSDEGKGSCFTILLPTENKV